MVFVQDWHTDQWNTVERPETDLFIFRLQFMTIDTILKYSRGENSLVELMVLSQASTWGKRFWFLPQSLHKTKSQMDCKFKYERWKYFYDFRVEMGLR